MTPPAVATPAPVTVTRQSAPPVSQPYSTARASANWTLDALAHSMASAAGSAAPARGNASNAARHRSWMRSSVGPRPRITSSLVTRTTSIPTSRSSLSRTRSASGSCSGPSSSTVNGWAAGWQNRKSHRRAPEPSPRPAASRSVSSGACGVNQCPASGPRASGTHLVRNTASASLSTSASVPPGVPSKDGSSVNTRFLRACARIVSALAVRASFSFSLFQPTSCESSPSSATWPVKPPALSAARSTPSVASGVRPRRRTLISRLLVNRASAVPSSGRPELDSTSVWHSTLRKRFAFARWRWRTPGSEPMETYSAAKPGRNGAFSLHSTGRPSIRRFAGGPGGPPGLGFLPASGQSAGRGRRSRRVGWGSSVAMPGGGEVARVVRVFRMGPREL